MKYIIVLLFSIGLNAQTFDFSCPELVCEELIYPGNPTIRASRDNYRISYAIPQIPFGVEYNDFVNVDKFKVEIFNYRGPYTKWREDIVDAQGYLDADNNGPYHFVGACAPRVSNCSRRGLYRITAIKLCSDGETISEEILLASNTP